MRPALNYFGGKYTSAKWIIENMPECRTYVEPFGGAASVLLRRDRVKNEIYNDLDSTVVNFFKVLRDKSDELESYLRNTPYSREVYTLAKGEPRDDIEAAAFTVIRSLMGIGDSLVSDKRGFRSSISQNSNPANGFKNYVDKMYMLRDRFRGVVIENISWDICVDRYDRESTLFYIDPPYIHSTRITKDAYRHEMDLEDHKALVDKVMNIKGKCIISGYDNDLYDSMGWDKISKVVNSQKTKRTEVLWIKPK